MGWAKIQRQRYQFHYAYLNLDSKVQAMALSQLPYA